MYIQWFRQSPRKEAEAISREEAFASLSPRLSGFTEANMRNAEAEALRVYRESIVDSKGRPLFREYIRGAEYDSYYAEYIACSLCDASAIESVRYDSH